MSADRISAEALLARIESGAAPLILDVRSRLEFARGHVPGARHIPFWQVSRQIDESSIPRDAELVVYCGHGPRAVQGEYLPAWHAARDGRERARGPRPAV
jgi:rhodanese-related sulfurtransferase